MSKGTIIRLIQLIYFSSSAFTLSDISNLRILLFALLNEATKTDTLTNKIKIMTVHQLVCQHKENNTLTSLQAEDVKNKQ